MSVKIKEISKVCVHGQKIDSAHFFVEGKCEVLPSVGTRFFAKCFSLELNKPLKIFLSYLAMRQLKISQYSTEIIEFYLKHSSQSSFAITIQWGPCNQAA